MLPLSLVIQELRSILHPTEGFLMSKDANCVAAMSACTHGVTGSLKSNPKYRTLPVPDGIEKTTETSPDS